MRTPLRIYRSRPCYTDPPIPHVQPLECRSGLSEGPGAAVVSSGPQLPHGDETPPPSPASQPGKSTAVLQDLARPLARGGAASSQLGRFAEALEALRLADCARAARLERW
jgi:hypothetical protein